MVVDATLDRDAGEYSYVLVRTTLASCGIPHVQYENGNSNIHYPLHYSSRYICEKGYFATISMCDTV